MSNRVAQWSLSFHPTPRLVSSSGIRAKLTNLKHFQLLARLANAAEPVPRQILAESLWPFSQHCLPRENLRSAIYTINRACGGSLIESRNDCLLLAPNVVQLIGPTPVVIINEPVCPEFQFPATLQLASHQDPSTLVQAIVDSEFTFELAPVDVGIRLLDQVVNMSPPGPLTTRVKALRYYLKTIEGTSKPHLNEIVSLCNALRHSRDCTGLFRASIAASHTLLTFGKLKQSEAFGQMALGAAKASKDNLLIGQAELGLGLVEGHGGNLPQATARLQAAKEHFLNSGNPALAGTAAMIKADLALTHYGVSQAEPLVIEMQRLLSDRAGRMFLWGQIQMARLEARKGMPDSAYNRLAHATVTGANQCGFSAHARAKGEIASVLADIGEHFESAIHLAYSDRYRWRFGATPTLYERSLSRAVKGKIKLRLNENDLRSVRRIASRRVEVATHIEPAKP